MKYVLLVLFGVIIHAHAAERVVQYRGDRNGLYEHAQPSALEWDIKTGKNIRWTALTPNWGYGHPLVVGDQVIVVDEPGWEHSFPVITSYDLKTGKQNWLTEINHLSVLGISKEEQNKVETVLSELWANFRIAYTHSYEGYLVKAGKKTRTQAETDAIWQWLQSIDPKKWNDKEGGKGAFGTFFEGKQKRGFGGLRGWDFSSVGLAKYPDLQKVWVSKYGLKLDNFWGFNDAREGSAAPAPVSDGTNIYWGGDFGSRVCLNLDGSIKWMVWHKHQHMTAKSKHRDSDFRSPILWNGLLIMDTFKQTVAYDCATGSIKWICDDWQGAANGPETHSAGDSSASSHIMEVDGQHFHLNNHGAIVHLETGKLAMHNFHELRTAPNAPNAGFGHNEMATIDAHNLVIRTSTGKRPKYIFANKLNWDGTQLSMEEIWAFTIADKPELKGIKKPGWGISAAVCNNTIYINGFAIDALSGAVTPTKTGGARWLRATNGSHLFGFNEGGSMSIHNLATGTLTSVPAKQPKGAQEKGSLRSEAMQTAMRKRHIATFGLDPARSRFSYSAPFLLVDDAIILRGASHLICIGK